MSSGNLIGNGNFGTGNFADWTLGGNYDVPWSGVFISQPGDPTEGGSAYAVVMNSQGTDGTLSQTIATTAGQTYTLSFWLEDQEPGTSNFSATWDGQTELSLTNTAAFGYTEYTYVVTATSSTSTLEFSAAGGPFFLDNVSLTVLAPTPPVISAGVENSNQSVTLTGTAPDGATVTVWDGSTSLGTTTTSSTGAWSLTTGELSAGSYSFTATDQTTTTASSPLTLTVTAPPVISTGLEISNQSVTLTGTAPDGATVTVYGLTTSTGATTALGTATASSTGAWSFATAALSTGIYDFTATQTTSAGTSSASSPLVVGVSANPVTFYVSSEIGNNNNAGTSESDPLATLQAAEALVQPGDIVEVMNGTYAPVDITTSGTASAPITFEAAPGQTPIINSSGTWNGINIQASYIIIDGFTVVGDAASYTLATATAGYSTGNADLDGNGIGINPSSSVPLPSNITIENNTVYNEPGGGIYTEGADYLQILNNVVYDNAHWSAFGNSGISVSESVNADTNPGVHDIISGNLVFGNAQLVPTYTGGGITDGEGIILDTNPNYTGEILVRDNTIYDSGGPGIESYLTNGAVITGNFVRNNDLENTQVASSGEIFINQSTDTVTNNSTTAPNLTPPAAPVISGDTVNGIAGPVSVTLNGTAEAYSTLTVYDNSTELGTTTTNGSGAWTFTTAPLADGSESFTATATDSAGNVSPLSSPLNLTLNVPVNLVANGNFATGDFTDWTLGGNYTDSSGAEIQVETYFAVAPSTYAACLDSSGSNGTLSQTIATTAGQTYTLTFWLLNQDPGANNFSATWNGATELSLTNKSAFGYTEYTYTVTATSSTSTLQFSAAGGPWFVDNISVTQNGTSGPVVSSIAESPSNGDLNAGKIVTYTISLSEAVTVNTAGGSPTLTFNDGGTGTYVGGSGTNALTFSYTVAAGQNTPDLTVTSVNLNGATVKDGSGNAANLSLTGLTQTGPQIDTSAPAAPIMVSDEIIGTRVALTGTAAAGNIVSIYDDGTTLLGTTSSNSTGNWVFVTPSETNGAHTFTATATDTAGNVSALSNAIDPDVGAAPSVNAAAVEVGNQYYLYNSSGSDVALTLAGADVMAGEFGGWTPIGAVQTASGYDVAWKMAGANEYTVWVTNSSGNAIANLTGPVSGTSYALESLESTFNQDLNGDGVIGLTTTVIQVDGSTSLTEVANRFYLDGTGGSGPALQLAGADVTAGEFGGWTPIGAVQTASGYDVAWKMAGANEYTVWVTNSNGNAIANLTGPVSGTSTALESLESIFNQDLNGDGVIGLYAAPGTAMQISTAISGPATIGTGATLQLAGADSGSVTFASSKGTLVLDHSSTFSGQIIGFTGDGTLSGSDQIDLKDINFNTVQDSYTNGVLTVTDGVDTAKLSFSGSYVMANFSLASDGSGGTIVYDPPVSNFGAGSGTAADSGSPSVTDPAAFGSTAGADTLPVDPQNPTGFGSLPVTEPPPVDPQNPVGFGSSVGTDTPAADPHNSIGLASAAVTDGASGGMHNSHGYGGSTVIDPPLAGAANQSNDSGSPSDSDPAGFGSPPIPETPPVTLQNTTGFGSPPASGPPPVGPQNPTGFGFMPDPQNGTNGLSMPTFGAAATLGYFDNGIAEGTVLATNGSQGANIALLGNYMASSFPAPTGSLAGSTQGADGGPIGNSSSLLTHPQHA